jgi:hypothetical protein
MSVIPKLVALSLAATLSSPIQQHQIGYSTGDPDTNRITQLWLVTYVDGKGLEVDRIRELLKIVFSSGPRGAMRRTLGLAAIHI